MDNFCLKNEGELVQNNMNTLSVVFSFRNEEEVLPELLKRIRKVLQGEVSQGTIDSYELIFVDDASTDHSFNILFEHAQGNKDIRIIKMSRCFGPSPSPCVLAGMQHASGDAVIYMDVDLQDPPEVIPEMLRVWQRGEDVDVVHAVRESREGEPRIKLFVTRIGYFLLNKITSIHLPVEAGDFKLLSRRVVNHLVQLREKRPFLRGLVCWVGFKQGFVKYKRESRYAGKTKFPVFGWKVMSNFFSSALISFSSAPLKISVFVGFLAILADFGLLIHVLLEKIQGRAIPGWTAIMIAILFVGSIQFLCIGIMGLYLNSIFEEIKGRPNFIIEKTYGFPEDIK